MAFSKGRDYSETQPFLNEQADSLRYFVNLLFDERSSTRLKVLQDKKIHDEVECENRGFPVYSIYDSTLEMLENLRTLENKALVNAIWTYLESGIDLIERTYPKTYCMKKNEEKHPSISERIRVYAKTASIEKSLRNRIADSYRLIRNYCTHNKLVSDKEMKKLESFCCQEFQTHEFNPECLDSSWLLKMLMEIESFLVRLDIEGKRQDCLAYTLFKA